MKDPATVSRLVIAALLLVLGTSSCAIGNHNHSRPQASMPVGTGKTQRGMASFYRVRTNGRATASGIPFSDSKNTAAHRTLPFGTLVKVTNKRNGRSQLVRITDRGPFIRGRIIDVSLKTAHELDMIDAGVVPVEIEIMRPPNRA